MNANAISLDQKFLNVRGATLRHTVAAVLITAGKQVMLVQSAKDPEGKTWAFPQGEIEEGETLKTALLREVAEEVGWKGNLDMNRAKVLWQHENEIPIDRQQRDGDLRNKHIIYIGVPVTSMEPVRLSRENSKFTFVNCPNALWFVSGCGRQAKLTAMFTALNRACEERLLGWSRDSFTFGTQIAA